MQQASKAIQALGLLNLSEAIISTKHIIHTTQGEIIGEWGMRKWIENNENKNPKRTNLHIARQSLRFAMLNQLNNLDDLRWNHKLVNFKQINSNEIELNFNVNETIKTVKTNIVVGADGIRSTVRNLIINKEISPLQYLGCIVILGICSLESLNKLNSPLLDGQTVFQTANGLERIYVMPFDSNAIMWQFSFPMPEKDAITLSSKGARILKEEAIKRMNWHLPIPQILENTLEENISGYPVYDRKILDSSLLQNEKSITLLGDAAHPMSPFKGQGANQAILDSLSLARIIYKTCNKLPNWEQVSVREKILDIFEKEMISRTISKVKGSKDAVQYLHSEIVLHASNQPRGRIKKSDI